MTKTDLKDEDVTDTDIAIVGMALHVPGAGDVAQYWSNLRDGVESIRPLTEDELLANGEAMSRLRKPNYVPAAAILDGFETFDADFFGFSPKEAAILDPQHRQFLEVAWEALEDAGHPPEGFPGAIGVYAGCGMGSYFYFNLCSNRDLVDQTGMFLLRHTGNDKDFLSTRVSHIFDLRGPSINVQTACSTSLVAVHFASQALISGECDMALAGGVTVELPHGRGYLFTEGEILSPDGHCHAFDHRAQGTVFGSGAGCVVLRRARDAIRDGDHIWAIIKGSAINNDGAAKAGYLAPSVDGQAACIAEAQAMAGVRADEVSYIECHGTGTYLGDPIEVAALTQAFRETTDAVGTCRIGSVKTNIGHLDTAAGVASLIKVALSLHHRQMPPSLGYEAPNPSIDFETSPFRVNDRLSDWTSTGVRKAGINSLGVGGTNAHTVLQEAPSRQASGESPWPFQPIVVSAKSKSALDAASLRLARHLRDHPEQPLADVAYTLKAGRRAFEKRRVLVAADHQEAAALLEGADPRKVFSHEFLGDNPEVVFMFPGGGAQFAGMARDLYETEPVFADWMDRGLAILEPKLDYDIRALWLPKPGGEAAANDALKRPSVQLPLIMITEFALAKLYESWGVTPAALVGHSMGENTAACLAGVISFEDCIGLVLLRGQLFDTIAPGGMLAVPLPEPELKPYLTGNLDLASVNAPTLCVVSGPDADLAALAAKLAVDDIESTRVAIDIAAHSRMLEPILKRFGDYLRSVPLSGPSIPIISNRTGLPLTDAQARDPEYWVAHLRNTVHFQTCMDHLTAEAGRVFLEMGPGRAMSSLAQANGVPAGQVIAALRHPEQAMADDAWHMATLARLWACGVAVDWDQIWGDARRLKVPLPTYAFQRKPYFIQPGKMAEVEAAALPMRIEDPTQWGWKPHWRPTSASVALSDLEGMAPQNWLIFADETGLSAGLADRLRKAGHAVRLVRAGDTFLRESDGSYVVSPERGREGYDPLVRDLVTSGFVPNQIVHAWLVTRGETFRPGSSFMHRNLEQGFFALTFLAQSIAEENLPRPITWTVLTSDAVQVNGERIAYPEKATVLGPVRVIPRELPGITLRTMDLQLPPVVRRQPALLDPTTDAVLEVLMSEGLDTDLAMRGTRLFKLDQKALALEADTLDLPTGAHVLITGGFGGIGLTIAESLITRFAAKITLIARRPLPDASTWDGYLDSHDPTDPLARRILALRRLQSLGGTVCVEAADVCNLEEMQTALRRASTSLGPVKAVIHAAGVVDDAPLMTKSSGQIETVLAPKVHGTRVLDELFPDGSLDWLVLFSSTSTVTGPAGQIDYVAANEYLNAFAKARSGGKTRVLALNWGIWSDVGMAAETLAERAGHPEAPRLPVQAPMLDEAGFDRQGNRLFAARLGTDRWVLDGHRTKDGQSLVPGTGVIELAAEAMALHGETGPVELRDLYFFRPLAVGDQAPVDIQAILQRTDEGYGFELRSAVIVGGRTGWQTHAQGRVLPLGLPAGPLPMLDVAAIRSRLPQPETGKGLVSPQETHLSFGPRWRVLSSRTTANGEGLADLELPPEFAGETDHGWLMHPALLDLATGWAMELIAGYDGQTLWVPVSYAQIRIFRPLPARIVSWVRSGADNRGDGATATFDVTLATPDGQICAEIIGFDLRRLDGALSFAAPSQRDLTFTDANDLSRPVSPAEERLLHAFSQGIRPSDGALAFSRALSTGLSQVFVSSLDLPLLARQTQEAEAARNTQQSFDRPELDNDFVEPRNDVERTLVGFWQDLLGVGKVGVEDSFFDLGGHSLIAVRLFAMVKKAFRVDFPISILFEAPTVAACAALIIEQVGEVGQAAESADQAPIAAPKRRFSHLVPMHEGEGRPKTPFFLVAGMFGNVLNLRHLAHLLGDERPFYGLQARGLFGDAEPHRTLDAAAADYIAEIRQVQPQGPYFLGGFSGGGLTAWEMARQLEAAGEEVALLVLLDTPLPQQPVVSRGDKVRMKLSDIKKKGPRYVLEWARNRADWKRQSASHAHEHATPAAQFHNQEIEQAFRAAIADYRMSQRAGQTVLFRPPLEKIWRVGNGQWVNSERDYVYEDNNLTQFAAGLEVIEVPGNHDSMVLEPNVRVLAARMRVVIAAAEGTLSKKVLAGAAISLPLAAE